MYTINNTDILFNFQLIINFRVCQIILYILLHGHCTQRKNMKNLDLKIKCEKNYIKRIFT